MSKKLADIEIYKVFQELRKLNVLDENDKVRPEAEESARKIKTFLESIVMLPIAGAMVATVILAVGTGSVMFLWWLLFV